MPAAANSASRMQTNLNNYYRILLNLSRKPVSLRRAGPSTRPSQPPLGSRDELGESSVATPLCMLHHPSKNTSRVHTQHAYGTTFLLLADRKPTSGRDLPSLLPLHCSAPYFKFTERYGFGTKTVRTHHTFCSESCACLPGRALGTGSYVLARNSGGCNNGSHRLAW